MSEQSPITVEAPTVIVSNSNEELDNAGEQTHSSNEAHSDGASGDAGPGDGPIDAPQSEGVAIAAIEAERDITLAAISSETERARIEVEAERVETVSEVNEEIELCRREIAELAGKITALENLLTPPPPLEIVETEELPTVPETDLTQPSTAAPTVETQTEHSEESVEERVEEAIQKVERRFRAI